jgi:hypothetical protein
MPGRAIDRRTFLRAAAAVLPLPFLDAMRPAFAADRAEVPRRLLAVETNLGILPRNFFPTESGRDYKPSPYLEVLKAFRNHFTVFSGVTHGDSTGGHAAEVTFLTAAPHPERPSFRNTISLDQFAAQHVGDKTRFPTLSLRVAKGGNGSLSYTADGVMIPAERKPSEVFKRMFVTGNAAEVEAQLEELRLGRSVLDAVGERSKRLQAKVGPADRARLDQYATAVRELERRLHAAQEWEKKPKPQVSAKPPADSDFLTDGMRAMFDLTRLTFETDSTRLVTLMLSLDSIQPHVDGVTEEPHNLSHHGSQPGKLDQLTKLEAAQFGELAKLFDGLQAAKEGDSTLLDRSMVLYGSNLGDANNHSTRNMPVLLAGGGFRHGQHLAFDRERNYPLPNLFVSILQRLGVAADQFASSTGTMRGLEMA